MEQKEEHEETTKEYSCFERFVHSLVYNGLIWSILEKGYTDSLKGIKPQKNNYARNTVAALIGFAAYAARMFLVEPLWTHWRYIPVLSPVYGQGEFYKSSARNTFNMLLHVAMGIVMMLCGSVQFDKVVRHKYPIIHRMSGYVYILCGTGIIFTIFRLEDITGSGKHGTPQLGMQTFNASTSTVWVVTILLAIYYIKTGQIMKHRGMMLRNFMVALVPISQRIFNFIVVALCYILGLPFLLGWQIIFGRIYWDTGEKLFGFNGFGRFQQELFPWSAWLALFFHMAWAEVKLSKDQDLWVPRNADTRQMELWDFVRKRIYKCGAYLEGETYASETESQALTDHNEDEDLEKTTIE